MDIDLHRIGPKIAVEPEELILHHGLGHDLAATAQQQFQQLRFAHGQRQRLGVDIGDASLDDEFQSAAAERLAGIAVATPQDGEQPRVQFVNVERLDHIFVGPFVQAANTRVDRAACAQHEHGPRVAARAHPRQQSDAVFVGQAEVEQHCRIIDCGEIRFGFANVACAFHRHTAPREGIDQRHRHFIVVLDQQHPHSRTFCTAAICKRDVSWLT